MDNQDKQWLAEAYGELGAAFFQEGLIPGRMISGSKSWYRKNYPENRVFFNANIFVLGEGKVWWGDLDITKDQEQLEKISAICGKKLYVLQELDGRFENENADDEWVTKRAVAVIG
jgi:hypothetical protein